MDQPKAEVTSDARKIGHVIHLAFAVLVGVVPVLAGVAVFGWQVKCWLREGCWHAMPIGAAVYRVLPQSFWVEICGSWVGLQKVILGILDGIPLSWALAVLGIWISSEIGPSDKK